MSFSRVLCCLCLFVAAQQARTGSLTGRITDERDGLIVGAQVTLTASDGTQKSTLTNAQGLYTVAALPAGTSNVWLQSASPVAASSSSAVTCIRSAARWRTTPESTARTPSFEPTARGSVGWPRNCD